MTTKYGVFEEPEYLHSLYGQAQKQDSRNVGLSFKATVGRHGKNNDATFDKFKPLFEKEGQYVEPLRARLLAEAEQRKKNISGAPFKPANPMKQSAAPGDFIGTLGGKVEYMSASQDVRKKKGEIPSQPKNIVTCPAKKGSFGFIKTTLSERQGAKGVVGEYEYHADPIDYQKRLAAAAAKEEGKEGEAAAAHAPFRPTSPAKKGHYGMMGTTISGDNKGSVGEYGYVEQGAPAKKELPPHLTPFKPGHSCRGGMAATFERYPKYEHDPETLKAEARAKAIAEEQKHGFWKPNHGNKTDCIRSIVRMNLK